MKSNVQVLCHSSIKITGEKTIYVDPFKIEKDYNDADYIFCTHSHYDHFSEEDIKRVIKEDTKIIVPKSTEEEVLNSIKEESRLYLVEPGKNYQIDNLEFETTYSYNENKKFHPKENKWVGYIITANETRYYIAGDTDNIKEIQDIKCDVALIPVGGTYTMNYEEAAALANRMDAKLVIPTHYGSIVGEKDDGRKFEKLVKNKEVKIFNY